MKTPLVSVIIPTYNRSSLIKRSIASVLTQSYPKLEIVVVDDASTDQTSSVISKLQKSHPHLKYYRLEHNSGEVAARNYGIKVATGTLITFLDSDDELTPSSIKSRVERYYDSQLETPLVYGDFNLNGDPRPFQRKIGHQYPYLMRELSLCGIVAVLLNRQALLKAGLPDESLPSWGDDDLILTYARHNPIVHVGEVVANIYTSTDFVSIDQTRNYLGAKIMVNKYRRDILKYHGYFRLLLWHIRLVRLQVLQLKSLLSQSSNIFAKTGIIMIRIFMYLLDKFLYLWFDNLFV